MLHRNARLAYCIVSTAGVYATVLKYYIIQHISTECSNPPPLFFSSSDAHIPKERRRRKKCSTGSIWIYGTLSGDVGGDLSKQNTAYNDIVYKVLSTHTEFEREREKKNEETLNAKRCHIRTDGKTNEKFRFYLEEFCGPWSQKTLYIYRYVYTESVYLCCYYLLHGSI